MQTPFPKRIISLVPSQTELLFDLGLNEEVIGITKFCIHPAEWFKTKTRVGGTKTVNIEKVKALQPDLIIANKEENVKDQIEALKETTTVYVSDIATLEDALDMIRQVGQLVGKQERADEIVEKINKGFEQLGNFNNPYSTFNFKRNTLGEAAHQLTHSTPSSTIKAAYLIWKDPYMAVGGDTFINDMMERCGFENIFKHITRYPEVIIDPLLRNTPSSFLPPIHNQQTTLNTTLPSINYENCELLLLSSEPFPFKQKHIDELQHLLPRSKIVLVDGEMFSWYGSRLLFAAEYFQKLISELNK